MSKETGAIRKTTIGGFSSQTTGPLPNESLNANNFPLGATNAVQTNLIDPRLSIAGIQGVSASSTPSRQISLTTHLESDANINNPANNSNRVSESQLLTNRSNKGTLNWNFTTMNNQVDEINIDIFLDSGRLEFVQAILGFNPKFGKQNQRLDETTIKSGKMGFQLTLRDSDLPKLEDISWLRIEYKMARNALASQVQLSITRDNHTIGPDEVGTSNARLETLKEKCNSSIYSHETVQRKTAGEGQTVKNAIGY